MKNKIVVKIIAFLVKCYIDLVWKTSRVKFNIDRESESLLKSNRAAIVVLWHNRILLTPKIMSLFSSFAAVVSAHNDGGLLVNFLEQYGHVAIRGSSRRGGFQALKGVLSKLNDNESVFITPDGPLGPRFSINGNLITVAERTKVPIIMFCYSVKRARTLNTWDKFIIPYPFNNIEIEISPLLYFPNEFSNHEKKHLLQTKMLKQMERLEAINKVCNGGCVTYYMYKLFSYLIHPFLYLHLRRRVLRDKENDISVKEKMANYSQKRPLGKLVWIHAASVGEAKSVVPLIEGITKKYKASVLFTVSTVTAYNLLKTEVAKINKVIVVFIVLDTPQNTKLFYKHWYPDLGLFVDSELWPNLLVNAKFPLMLINARISPASFQKWRRFNHFFRLIMNNFSYVSVTTNQDDEFLRALGIEKELLNLGNLKNAAPCLTYDQQEFKAMNKYFQGFVLACASTHEGEEEGILKMFRDTDVKIIIAPRHPKRSKEIADVAIKYGYQVSLKSDSKMPEKISDKYVYIMDEIGNLGLCYALASIAFVGGSLVNVGGHNMIEAIKLKCPVITGKYTYNFTDSVDFLRNNEAIIEVDDFNEFKREVLKIKLDKSRQKQLLNQVKKAGKGLDNEIIDNHLKLIGKVLHAKNHQT